MYLHVGRSFSVSITALWRKCVAVWLRACVSFSFTVHKDAV